MRRFARIALIAGAACLAAAPVLAAETVETADGILNPPELTMDYYARLTAQPGFDPKMCIFGYPAAKMGNHVLARKIFERCASNSVMATLPWMAWVEENGYDQPSNPAKAAEWDRKAADLGYSIGQFNYGVDLLRGHGVARDEILGRSYIDRAARQGDAGATELARQGYDPEVVTPSADADRYRQPAF